MTRFGSPGGTFGTRRVSRARRLTLCLGLTLYLGLALCAGLSLTGCGKKGPPRPVDTAWAFSLRDAAVEQNGTGCLVVSGSVNGAGRDVAALTLELQAVDQSCEGCPFVPQEAYSADAAAVWESPAGDSFRFAYCPGLRSDAYRWRLVGHNAHRGLPDVSTPVRVSAPRLSVPE